MPLNRHSGLEPESRNRRWQRVSAGPGRGFRPRIKYGVTFFRRNDRMSSHTYHYTDFVLLALIRPGRLQQIAYDDFGIVHITIQIEQSLEGCAERHHFDHLLAPDAGRVIE